MEKVFVGRAGRLLLDDLPLLPPSPSFIAKRPSDAPAGSETRKFPLMVRAAGL